MNNQNRRSTTFETFEPRLVMSAQALSDFVADFHIAQPDFDIDQQIETLNHGGGQLAGNTDIESIRAQYNLDGTGQTIAVIDSGIAYDHQAFGGGFGLDHRVVGGYDFAENDTNPYDDGPIGLHGTHVAGIIGGDGSTATGLAPGADLVSLRVFDDNGVGELEWVEQALQWVHEHRNDFENPITTVNLSLGTDWNSSSIPDAAELEDEFAQLKTDGIFVSVAAGNAFEEYNQAGVSYPAASPFVVPVASHDAQGNLSDFSQRDERVLVAPGENILSAVPDHVFGGSQSDGYLRSSGTSQAAPFVAGASALLRQAFEFTGVDDVDQDLLYSQFMETADLIFDSVTGDSYHRINLHSAIAAVIGDDHGNAFSTATNVGTIAGGEIIHGMLGSTLDRDHFVFQATQTGTVTLELDTTNGLQTQVDVAGTTAQQNGNRVTLDVSAGSQYHFSVSSNGGTGYYEIGIQQQVPSVPPAPVSLHDGRLVIQGTAADDNITFQQGAVIEVVINGEGYQFNQGAVSEVVIAGSAGNDTISVGFSQAVQRATLRSGRVDVLAPAFDLTAHGFENIDLQGGAGSDRLIVRDSNGNDNVVAGFDGVAASGNGHNNYASGFSRVLVRAGEGFDQISLQGTAGDDRFVAGDGRNVLRTEGQRLVALDFDQTAVIASGGQDVARLAGSNGHDRFELDAKSFFLDTDQYQVWGSNFERIRASSTAGNDTIHFAGSHVDDLLIHRTVETQLRSDHYFNSGEGFSDIIVVGYGGNDSARIFDTAGNDQFSFAGNQTRFQSAHQTVIGYGFESIDVFAHNGGWDQAEIVGSAGHDQVTAATDRTRLSIANGREVTIRDYDRVVVDTAGGFDTTVLQGGQSRDVLRTLDGGLEFESTAQMLRLVNAESHDFDGGGGVDEAVFTDFDSLDLLQAIGDQATAFLNSQQIVVSDIEFLDARVAAGENSFYDIDAVDFLFLLDGHWQQQP